MRARAFVRDIALQRIERLFELAETFFEDDDDRRRCVELARRIGMRYRVRLPKHLKMKMCRKCNAFLIPGLTARVRLRPKRRYITTTCLRCGHETRRPYKTPRPPSPHRSNSNSQSQPAARRKLQKP
ncbi:ribonuclease P protein component 4 [Candidatus Alkanophaga liquidiphilum]